MKCWLIGCLVVLMTSPGWAEESVKILVEQLASETFKTRITAEKKLRALPADKIPELQAFVESEDVEIRSRVKSIIQYIRDNGPQGVSTLQATIMDVSTSTERRAKAIAMLCVMVGNGDQEAVGVLGNVAALPTLGVPGDKGRLLQSQVMTAIQQGIYELGARAPGNPEIEAGLIACLERQTLRNHAVRALGNAAGKGSKKALETLLNPSDIHTVLSVI